MFMFIYVSRGEHKETIKTGTKAAARGGFTTVCPMPNTRPVPDSVEHMDRLQQLIQDNAQVRITICFNNCASSW